MQATCLCLKMASIEKMQFSSYWHFNCVILNVLQFLDFFRETHPPSFKLDLFIRNLDRPSDVVFEKLGQ